MGEKIKWWFQDRMGYVLFIGVVYLIIPFLVAIKCGASDSIMLMIFYYFALIIWPIAGAILSGIYGFQHRCKRKDYFLLLALQIGCLLSYLLVIALSYEAYLPIGFILFLNLVPSLLSYFLMSKCVKALFICFIVLSLGVMYLNHTIDDTRISVASYNPHWSQKHVANIGETYFYQDHEGIHEKIAQAERLIVPGQKVGALAAEEDYLYGGVGDSVIKWDKEGKEVTRYKAEYNITGLYISGQYLYAQICYDEVLILDKKALVPVDKKKVITKTSYMQDGQNAYVLQQIDTMGILTKVKLFKGKANKWTIDDPVLRSGSTCLVDMSRNEMIINHLLTSTYWKGKLYDIDEADPKRMTIYEVGKEGKIATIPREEMGWLKPSSYFISDNQLMLIEQNNEKTIDEVQHFLYKILTGQRLYAGNEGGRLPIDLELVYHQYDSLTAYDLAHNKQTFKHLTRPEERIVYADAQVAMTYYKRQLITYDTPSWQVKSQEAATYIKKNKMYDFERCGKYLFIYDQSDRLIHRVILPQTAI